MFTDHSVGRAGLQNPGASGRHARWWTEVYAGSGIADLNVIYRPGKENTKADDLSRSPQRPAPVFGEAETEIQVSTITGDIGHTIDEMLRMEPDSSPSDLHSFAREQRKDEKINQVILFLETEKLSSDDKKARKVALQSSNFTIEDEVLYFLDSKHNHRKRAVVPSHLRERLMKEVHGGPFSGHFQVTDCTVYSHVCRGGKGCTCIRMVSIIEKVVLIALLRLEEDVLVGPHYNPYLFSVYFR